MHPILRERRALVAYLAVWLGLSYLPASLLASPGEGRFLLALALAAPATLLFGLGALPVYYLCQAAPLQPSGLGRVLRWHAALGLTGSVAWWVLLELAARLVDWAAAAQLAGEVERRGGALLALGATLYFAVVAFYTLVSSTQQARAAERRAVAASLQAREAQLALLQAQVHPHFLFNSLNAISALTVEDPRLARELCVLLADFLRGSLALGERGLVSLAEELRLARAYLEVERVRLGDAPWQVNLQSAPCSSPPCSCSRWWRTPSPTASPPARGAARCRSRRAPPRACSSSPWRTPSTRRRHPGGDAGRERAASGSPTSAAASRPVTMGRA